MNNQPSHLLRALSDADTLLVEPGFPVERRTIFGIHGDASDLALSLTWRDFAGCEWEADFTEQALMDAAVEQNRITLTDSEHARVCVHLHQMKPFNLVANSQI